MKLEEETELKKKIQILEEENKLLKKKNNKFNKKINKILQENKGYKQEIKNLKNKHTIEILETENTLLKKHEKNLIHTQNVNSHNKINNITQYIINKYPNAPNLEAPKEIENLEKYSDMGFPKGLSQMINDEYCKNIDPEDRSIWCVDPSRNKYLLKYKDKWNIDLDGKKFCDITKDKIGQMYNDYVIELLSEPKEGLLNSIMTLQEFTVEVLGLTKIPNDAKKFLVFNNDTIKDKERNNKENNEENNNKNTNIK